MKKLIVSLVITLAAFCNVCAMSYPEAAEQARYLTDKMAYELNLNEQQYNDCYEINLDYLLSVETADDAFGNYLAYRNADLRHILLDWQFTLFAATDYFFHPLYWRAGAWYYPVYRRYAPDYFYYSHPTVYWSYRGGHGRFHYQNGYYLSRRPQWRGGFRGHDRSPVVFHESHHGRHYDNYRGHGSDSYRSRSDNNRGGGYRIESSGRSGRSSNPGSGYQHPSSTRTTVHSSASSDFGSGSGRSYSIGEGRSYSVGSSRSSSMGSSRSSSAAYDRSSSMGSSRSSSAAYDRSSSMGSSRSSMGSGRSSSVGASRSQSMSSRGGAATRSASPSGSSAGSSSRGGSRRGGR